MRNNLDANSVKPVLSICISCRDGREWVSNVRAGRRLAKGILGKWLKYRDCNMRLRGVHCMSQCKRSCIVSLASEGCFTYVFGDLDPNSGKQVEQLFELLYLYGEAPEGFLERNRRPEEFRKNILGRLPPLHSKSALITDLEQVQT